MKCPYCSAPDSRVVNSRPSDDGASIRRRRECPTCARRFTTYERAQLEPLMVVKRSGPREAFNPDKLLRGLTLATEKRPVDPALLTAWLQAPHVRAFWDDGERDEAAVEAHYFAPERDAPSGGARRRLS